ncbi:hypothetical protein EIJ81_00725 (plasmid) [Aliivibrio salmonicida]|uniref:hypothetical protein n=1 Tax=Aliivibrio salmonicida TaxID=40269 RepID=UPI000F7185DB|nr:hypothetical protein [Aliivibrio salmonicida]AZL83423.1 hypothetical protein EIJ81_00725 [Aliivibrio salmonicida]
MSTLFNFPDLASEIKDSLIDLSQSNADETVSLVDDISSASFSTFSTRKDPVISTTPVQAYKAAITALHAMNSTNNIQDLENIYQFQGFGAMRPIFDESNLKHEKKRAELKSLISNDQYEEAMKASLTSFYTPHCVSNSIADGLVSLGVFNDNTSSIRITDPASGIGRLIAPLDSEDQYNSDITLIELDSLTHAMSSVLFPYANVKNTGFEYVDLPEQDIMLLNPPFGNFRLSDKTNNPKYAAAAGLKLHEFFLVKSILSLRENGLMIAIVPTSVMDSQDCTTRDVLSKKSNLISAVRVPSNMFNKYACTSTSVDVLVFQKTSQPESSPVWTNVIETQLSGHIYSVNSALDTLFTTIGKPEITISNNSECVTYIDSDLDTLDSRISRAVFKALIKANYTPFKHKIESHIEQEIILKTKPTNRMFTYALDVNDKLWFKGESGFIDTEIESKSKKYSRIVGMIEIAESLTDIYSYEQTCQDHDSNMITERANLNIIYDKYISKLGCLSNRANSLAFKADARFPELMSLESDFNHGITKEQSKRLNVPVRKESAQKAYIFSGRCYTPWVTPKTAKNAVDGLWINLALKAEIDIDLISGLTTSSNNDVLNALYGSHVVFDIELDRYILIDSYLSGDVKSKLALAESAIEAQPLQQKNVDILKKVIPVNIDFFDIEIDLTSHWLPASVVSQFLCDELGSVPNETSCHHIMGRWDASFSISQPNELSYSTATHTVQKIVSKIFSHSNMIVYQPRVDKEPIQINEEATAALKASVIEIKSLWTDFLFKNESVQNQLANAYNEKINRYAPYNPIFTDAYFPDQSNWINLYKHQIGMIRKAITAPSDMATLLAASMGSGKSATMFTIMHELVRLGLKKLFALVVPNHLVSQMAGEWCQLYNNDARRMLVLDPVALSPKQRINTLAKIKSGFYNFIIIPATTWKKIAPPKSSTEIVIKERLKEFQNSLVMAENRYTVREIETGKRKLEEELKALEKIDPEYDFMDLGIDGICYDESQTLKNSGYHTVKLRGVKGIGSTEASQTALDATYKVHYLLNSSQFTSGVILASGTPISNSLLEIYGLIRMCAPNVFKKMGIDCLDSFACTFTETSTDYEIGADGVIKLVNRLKQIVNIEELQAIFSMFAYTVTAEELNKLIPVIVNPDSTTRSAIVPMTGGKPIVKYSEPTTEILDYMESLTLRAANYKTSLVKNDNPLKLISDAKKCSVSMQMVDSTSTEVLSPKTKQFIQDIIDKYHEEQHLKTVQLGFVDIGTPSKSKDIKEELAEYHRKLGNLEELSSIGGVTINLYRHIKEALIKGGIKENEIAFVQDANTDIKKIELFEQINNGSIRVVLSSIAKLATGANIQARISAVRFLTPPYRPSDLFQAAARALRKGNLMWLMDPNFSVDIVYYALKNSTDAFLFQLLESKADFINRFQNSKHAIDRTYQEVDGETLTFSEIKAAVSGNMALITLFKTEKEIKDQKLLWKSYGRKMANFRNELEYALTSANKYDRRNEAFLLDLNKFKDIVRNGDLALTINNETHKQLDQNVAVKLWESFANFKSLNKKSIIGGVSKLGTLGQFEILGVSSGLSPDYISIKSTVTRNVISLPKGSYSKVRLLPALIQCIQKLADGAKRAANDSNEYKQKAELLTEALNTSFDSSILKNLELKKLELENEVANFETSKLCA